MSEQETLPSEPHTATQSMSLRVALDFADNPRPYPSMAAPADTNGELYRALAVLAAAYRAAVSNSPTLITSGGKHDA